ncbi:MAG TPA: hypothetical protein VNB22_16070 [Pyrinomonadaceae bacterium]|nr:hypothetical protein [Pyrinomonadaceae bacterium]
MYLQIAKNGYRNTNAPPVLGNDYFYKNQSDIHISEGAEFDSASGVSLPILATANDLREVVKFFKHKPNGVSGVEMTNAEPRRVFDARKIAAYEFWGILARDNERFQLTALGEELAKNTEAECEIHRRILRSVAAYRLAVEWIHGKNLKIATYLDVANFWQLSGGDLDLSPQTGENIESVIVSFFSLCHAAELGTATVGKRGQPARLSVRLDQMKAFLEAPVESVETVSPMVFNRPSVYQFEKSAGENIATVYISAGKRESESLNLRAALELADFASIAFGAENFENGFLPLSHRAAMKQCQAAIFLLDEKDCRELEDGKIMLRCDRVTEISVAQALFGERVILLWNSREPMPAVFSQSGFNVMNGDVTDWESNVKLVKCLKSLKG